MTPNWKKYLKNSARLLLLKWQWTKQLEKAGDLDLLRCLLKLKQRKPLKDLIISLSAKNPSLSKQLKIARLEAEEQVAATVVAAGVAAVAVIINMVAIVIVTNLFPLYSPFLKNHSHLVILVWKLTDFKRESFISF